MTIDLSFITSVKHRGILENLLAAILADHDIIGMMVIGSHARGDALPESDLDLMLFLREGRSREFQAVTIDHILVEYKYADLNKAKSRLETNPMEVYAYLDGQVLFDSDQIIETLMGEAAARFVNYRMDERERKAIHHWLSSAKIKIQAAVQSRDGLKASFVTASTSYKILEGLWTVCKKPLPPAGSIIAHLDDLKDDVPGIRTLFQLLFTGTPDERADTAIEMIEWIDSRILID
ncbi:nucleotidyltransferase domain-containing protein [Paenibacillus spongiae]|uniref:Nucleotidyltransferase domain-containing protein n=1 Tax=Paenibacillus spongiae TaxID=2909671 RepID=A0ABY5SFH9_9BACL|nr:nucleotidyltransferase domain-containing protein [Paenibacillus spongiae]UVI32739.1 nucleotidyltransferase domain-containing protein [Paenibacillus spongiae]